VPSESTAIDLNVSQSSKHQRQLYHSLHPDHQNHLGEKGGKNLRKKERKKANVPETLMLFSKQKETNKTKFAIVTVIENEYPVLLRTFRLV
jgi:hypothetical protein